jgi:PAS domain S-box-containing protein
MELSGNSSSTSNTVDKKSLPLSGNGKPSSLSSHNGIPSSSLLLILNNLDIPAAIINAEKILCGSNAKFNVFFSVEEVMITGEPVSDVVPELLAWANNTPHVTEIKNSRMEIHLSTGQTMQCTVNINSLTNAPDARYIITFSESVDSEEMQKLFLRKAHLNGMIYMLPESALVTSQDSIIVANHKAFELFGVTSEEELIGKKFSSFVSSEEDAVKHPELTDDERLVYRADGAHRIVEILKKAAPFAAGEINLIVLKDVTGRKETERNLLRLRSMVEQSEEFIGILNTSGQYEYVNQAFLKFTGYTPANVIGRSINYYFASQSPKVKFSKIKEALKSTGSYSAIDLCKKKSGELFYFEKTITPFKDAEEVVIGYIISGRDVTSRILFQEEFHKQTERSRIIVEQVSDIIFLLTGDGTIEYFSPAVTNALAIQPKNLIGQEFISLAETQTRISISKILHQAALSKSEDFSFEIRMMNNKNEFSTFQAVGKVFTEKDDIKKMLVVCRNITQLRALFDELQQYKDNLEKLVSVRTSELRSTNELLQSEILSRKEVQGELSVKDERLSLALEVSAYGLWDINLENSSIYHNERFSDILGIPADKKVIVDMQEFEKFIHPDDVYLFKDKFNNHLLGKSDIFEMEHRVLLHDKTVKYVSLRGKVVARNSEGAATRFIGRIEDVSLYRKAEEELQKALEWERELNELKSRFISIVSHEYRTPLATILSSSEVLGLYEGKLSSLEKQKQISKIESCVDEMTQLLDNVIIINKYDMKKMDHSISEFDIVSYTRNVMEDILPGFKITPRIQFYPEMKEFLIHSSPTLYKQILSNLLTNAIKYTPSDKTIEITIAARNLSVFIEVRDQGIGISQEDQKLLFEPFFRGENVGSIPGSGLGLPIVKRSVDALQGKLSVESQLNSGTTFTVELPVNYN